MPSYGWLMIPETAAPDESAYKVIGSSGSKCLRIGAVVNEVLSLSKASCAVLFHRNFWDFLRRSVRDRMTREYAWKEAGALQSPNGMTRYSKWPYLVRKAVFHSSPSATRKQLNASRTSSLVKRVAPLSLSIISDARGMG